MEKKRSCVQRSGAGSRRMDVILSNAKDLASRRSRYAWEDDMSKLMFVYIMTNRSGTLYIGVTSNLVARYQQHLEADESTFVGRYKLNRVVYVEATRDWRAAIAREKQLKGWTRRRKIALIEATNREWRNLMEGIVDSNVAAPGPSPSAQDDIRRSG